MRNNLKEYNYTKDELQKFQYAKITTNKKVIWIKLFVDEVANTVSNFATLANDGFYNNLIFHRVIPDFMAQGGCPDGTGMGGPDWSIKCETNAKNQIHNKGSLSMAHAGPNTGGSQFFICFVPCPHLDGGHTVFGEIEAGDEESFKVLDEISQDDKIDSIEILESKSSTTKKAKKSKSCEKVETPTTNKTKILKKRRTISKKKRIRKKRLKDI